VTHVRDGVPARRTRELVASALGAVLLLLAVSLPVLAAPPGPTQLQAPDVTPRTADTATPITFTVTYWNAFALPPEYVRAAVAGTTYAMSGNGTDWKAGVIFTVTTVLPAGTHAVLFEARDAERFVDEVDAGTVVIGQAAAPAPGPTPTPRPPAPEPDPTTPSGGSGTPDPTPGSDTGGTIDTGGAVGPNASGSPDDRDAGATADGTTAPNSSGGPDDRTGVGTSGGSQSGGSAGGDGSAPGPFGSAVGVGVAPSGATAGPIPGTGTPGQSDDLDAAGGGSATTPVGGALAALARLGDSVGGSLTATGLTGTGRIPTLPAVVGPTVLVTTWMAFVLFNRRRRDGEPPASEDVLHAAAATGLGIAAVLVPPIAPLDPEALMPRWRRPSLLEARKTDPIRAPAPERPKLTFAQGVVESSGGAERRPIRYAVIPLLDRPDEILATRIGELVEGDEVQVEGRSGAYCQVICPDGRQGWVHRTTLGEVIVPPRFGGGPAAHADEPEAENALAALLAARGIR